MKATDESVQLVWGDLLQIGSVGAASGAFAALLSRFPEWVPAAAASAGLLVIIRRYPAKAARSDEICRRLGEVHLEWEHLWNGVWTKDDAELVSAWKALSERQAAIVERVPPSCRSRARSPAGASAKPTSTGRSSMPRADGNARQISAVSLLSADDPPTFMSYSMAPGDPVPEGDRATASKVHHVNFGQSLKAELDAFGVENHLHYPGSHSEYESEADSFIRKFGESEILHLTGKALAGYHLELAKLLERHPNQTGEIYRQGVSGGVGGWTPLPEPADRSHYMSIVHRGGNSWAESHDQKADFYIMLEGSGRLLLGGKMIDAIQAEGRPGEWRAPRIENPRRFEARKGDLINIPVKTPHQWDLAEGESVTYVILKVVERDAEIRVAP